MTTASHPYTIPAPERTGPAVALAIAMHALLALMLFFGLRWHSTTPAVVEAQLWSALPQIAAPTPPPQPPPPVKETPKPVSEPKPVPTPPPPQKTDIVIKQEVPKKTHVEKVEPPPEKPSKPKPKVEPKPQPKPQPKPEVKTPPAPPSDLARIQNQLAQGTAAQTSAPPGNVDEYKARLVAKIRSNMRFPPSADNSGNPTVTVAIQQLPTGDVTSVTVVDPSGLPAFDAAVERAVQASSPLPKNEQGGVTSSITLEYKLFPTR